MVTAGAKSQILRKAIKQARISRIVAKGIDLFIVLLLSLFLYPIGLLFSSIYMAISDSLQNGQSVGKKFVGFAVVDLEDGTPCSVQQSLVRNLPFLIPLSFAIIPIWGVIFSLVLGAPLVALELYLLFKLDSGRRLGDVMANTTVMGSDNEKVSRVQSDQTGWFKENPYI